MLSEQTIRALRVVVLRLEKDGVDPNTISNVLDDVADDEIKSSATDIRLQVSSIISAPN